MATYRGWRNPSPTIVLPAHVVDVDGRRLPPFPELQEAFSWGDTSAESAHLSLAMLLHHLADEYRAASYCREFMWHVVSQLPPSWTLTSTDVAGFIEAIDAERRALDGAVVSAK